jgi:hypothetical protein
MAGRIGEDLVERIDHAEQFHLGNHVFGNSGTHEIKFSWVGIDATVALPSSGASVPPA